jgi:hypothetical protein
MQIDFDQTFRAGYSIFALRFGRALAFKIAETAELVRKIVQAQIRANVEKIIVGVNFRGKSGKRLLEFFCDLIFQLF